MTIAIYMVKATEPRPIQAILNIIEIHKNNLSVCCGGFFSLENFTKVGNLYPPVTANYINIIPERNTNRVDLSRINNAISGTISALDYNNNICESGCVILKNVMSNNSNLIFKKLILC